MELESVDKALAIIKPAEQRIEGWKKILPNLFEWEETNLREITKLDISEFIVKFPTVNDLPKLKGMDDKIKELKKLAALKEKERKDTTKPMDDLKKRLMIIEDAYTECANLIATSFISLKRIEKEENEKADKRKDDLLQFRTKIQQKFNNDLSNWNQYIEAKITEVYEDALELIDVDGLAAYLSEIKGQHTEKEFSYPQNKLFPHELQDKEKIAIVEEIFGKWDKSSLAGKFVATLEHTFSDFASAQLQKDEALKQRKAEELISVEEIKENEEVDNAIAVIEEKAAPSMQVAVEATRDLKVGYIIDMDHTPENMTKVQKAFFGNRQECFAMYQGKDCWNMNTIDMGNLLCKIKIKTPGFAPDGIIFKAVDKI